eukprot:TRINITY_DN25585_c0_g2_i1.p2 TRINITY_DN25585_c0_g2~~TRINITY_DN25585_c0_g2_i1.p2  ORF type:complete len:142 (+),score=2.72 TRINITY_DN25585_c0_g2_i1:329-754(+)
MSIALTAVSDLPHTLLCFVPSWQLLSSSSTNTTLAPNPSHRHIMLSVMFHFYIDVRSCCTCPRLFDVTPPPPIFSVQPMIHLIRIKNAIIAITPHHPLCSFPFRIHLHLHRQVSSGLSARISKNAISSLPRKSRSHERICP